MLKNIAIKVIYIKRIKNLKLELRMNIQIVIIKTIELMFGFIYMIKKLEYIHMVVVMMMINILISLIDMLV